MILLRGDVNLERLRDYGFKVMYNQDTGKPEKATFGCGFNGIGYYSYIEIFDNQSSRVENGWGGLKWITQKQSDIKSRRIKKVTKSFDIYSEQLMEKVIELYRDNIIKIC